MHTGFIFSRFLDVEKRRCCAISLFWLVGLLLGICLAATNSERYAPVTFAALTQESSFARIAFINCFTLTLIAFLRFYHRYLMILPIIFLLSLSRGFTGMAIYVLLGSGAWVVRMLFLFSSICVSVILWWLLLSRRDSEQCSLIRLLRRMLIAVLIISIVDYFVISPFLASITEQII